MINLIVCLPIQANWYKAAQYCRYHGMHLTSISNQEENDRLEKYIKDYGKDNADKKKKKIKKFIIFDLSRPSAKLLLFSSYNVYVAPPLIIPSHFFFG